MTPIEYRDHHIRGEIITFYRQYPDLTFEEFLELLIKASVGLAPTEVRGSHLAMVAILKNKVEKYGGTGEN